MKRNNMKKQVSQLYSKAKRATIKEARALKVGDLIECYRVEEIARSL